jgi:hypothetical protein
MLGCVLVLIGWWVFGGAADGEVVGQVHRAPRVTVATPDIPTVTVDSTPAGARVTLEGVDYGLAPATVPVPMDNKPHELCLDYKGERSCRRLTGEALAFQDPYRFVIAGK